MTDKTLQGLPYSLRHERIQKGKRIHSPGLGHLADWVNRYTLTLFPFTIGTTAVRVLPANPMRCYLVVQNKSGGTVFVNFGQNPTVDSSIDIPAGGNYIFEGGAAGGAFSTPDDVYLLGSATALKTVLGEGLWQSVSI